MNEKRELVYVCSPLSASTARGIRENMYKAMQYMKMVSCKYNCRAIAPHAILPAILDDQIPAERELGLKIGLDLLKICKKMVVCGTVISNGMKQEIELAEKLGIEIIYNDLPDPKAERATVKITIEIEGD